MLAGLARVDITPPIVSQTEMYIPILGWPSERGKLVDAVRDPLYARAVALSDGDRRAVVVACDSLGDHVGYSEPARQQIQQHTGLQANEVFITATHAHTTPETCDLGDRPVDAGWVTEMAERIARCAIQAVERLRPARLHLVRKDVSGLNANRRRSDRPCDREMSVLLAADEGGVPFGALIVFAAHPTTVQVHPFFSADYVGHALGVIESAMGTEFVGVFANGCCGDVRPEAPESEAGLVKQGDAVGKAGLDLIRQGAGGGGESVHGSVRTAVRDVTVQRQPVPPLDNLLAEREHIVEELGGDLSIPDRWPTGRRADLWYLDEKIALARGPASWTVPIRGLALGQLRAVMLPCEPLARVGHMIQSRAVDPKPVVIGYADPMLGYVGMQEEYDEGGYESIPARWARSGPGSGEAMAAAALDVLEELNRG
jgi:hypothetical protein